MRANVNPKVQACADWKKLIGLRYRSDPFRPHHFGAFSTMATFRDDGEFRLNRYPG